MDTPCPSCDGSGECVSENPKQNTYAFTCFTCKGAGVLSEEERKTYTKNCVKFLESLYGPRGGR